VQHTLGKQGKYDEAEQVKREADKTERHELQVRPEAAIILFYIERVGGNHKRP
jgi:hypothetical protein